MQPRRYHDRRRFVFMTIDVDECLRPGMCQHSCRNTWGSFQCMCDDGYQLAVDGRSCDGRTASFLSCLLQLPLLPVHVSV